MTPRERLLRAALVRLYCCTLNIETDEGDPLRDALAGARAALDATLEGGPVEVPPEKQTSPGADFMDLIFDSPLDTPGAAEKKWWCAFPGCKGSRHEHFAFEHSTLSPGYPLDTPPGKG